MCTRVTSPQQIDEIFKQPMCAEASVEEVNQTQTVPLPKSTISMLTKLVPLSTQTIMSFNQIAST